MNKQFQYISDTHLEFYQKNFIDFNKILKTGIAPYLILAGDIGDPGTDIFCKFICWCHKNWEKIFYVAGNHELFGYCKDEAEEKLTIALNYDNVYWLKEGILINISNDLLISGCTLWSYVPDEDISDATQYISNYKKIWKDVQKKDKHNVWIEREWHRKDKEHLIKSIEEATQRHQQLIIVTHYLPSMKCIPFRYQGSTFNTSYASLCDSLIKPPIITWFYGHSHDRRKTYINNIPCLINAAGYPNEFHGIERDMVWNFDLLENTNFQYSDINYNNDNIEFI